MEMSCILHSPIHHIKTVKNCISLSTDTGNSTAELAELLCPVPSCPWEGLPLIPVAQLAGLLGIISLSTRDAGTLQPLAYALQSLKPPFDEQTH